MMKLNNDFINVPLFSGKSSYFVDIGPVDIFNTQAYQ